MQAGNSTDKRYCLLLLKKGDQAMKEIGVCVYVSYDSIETARIVRMLESEGIPTYTKEEGPGELMRLYSGFSHSPTRIYVPESAKEQAQLLLGEDT